MTDKSGALNRSHSGRGMVIANDRNRQCKINDIGKIQYEVSGFNGMRLMKINFRRFRQFHEFHPECYSLIMSAKRTVKYHMCSYHSK